MKGHGTPRMASQVHVFMPICASTSSLETLHKTSKRTKRHGQRGGLPIDGQRTVSKSRQSTIPTHAVWNPWCMKTKGATSAKKSSHACEAAGRRVGFSSKDAPRIFQRNESQRNWMERLWPSCEHTRFSNPRHRSAVPCRNSQRSAGIPIHGRASRVRRSARRRWLQ